MFNKGIIINTDIPLETIYSSDYNTVESKIKNKLGNNWTELNNEITNQIKKQKTKLLILLKMFQKFKKNIWKVMVGK